MALDYSSLENALASLDALQQRAQDQDFMGRLDEVARKGIRAGVIQNFEFTYELCWKFLQRWIRLNRSVEEAEPRTRKDLFRLAARLELIEDPLAWFEYAEARNLTFHTYDESRAEEVFRVAVRFVPDAGALLAALQQADD